MQPLTVRRKIVKLGELAIMNTWPSGEKPKARIASASRSSTVSPAVHRSTTPYAVCTARQPSAVVTASRPPARSATSIYRPDPEYGMLHDIKQEPVSLPVTR